MMREVCFQREMPDAEAVADPRPQDGGSIDYEIEEIGADEAAEFIRRYEWLGTVDHPAARYCARNEFNEVAAVAILSAPANLQAAGICRVLDPKNLTDEDRAYIETVVCLERRACARWAHRHAASWFKRINRQSVYRKLGTAAQANVAAARPGWRYVSGTPKLPIRVSHGTLGA
jgi:hypothetical protein